MLTFSQRVKAEQNVHTVVGAHAMWSGGVQRTASAHSSAGGTGDQPPQRASSAIVAHDAPARAHVLSL